MPTPVPAILTEPCRDGDHDACNWATWPVGLPSNTIGPIYCGCECHAADHARLGERQED